MSGRPYPDGRFFRNFCYTLFNIGQTHGNWLTIKYLWVKENLRGQRLGTERLKRAESIAKERGCRCCFFRYIQLSGATVLQGTGIQRGVCFRRIPHFTEAVLSDQDLIKSDVGSQQVCIQMQNPTDGQHRPDLLFYDHRRSAAAQYSGIEGDIMKDSGRACLWGRITLNKSILKFLSDLTN